LSRPDCDVAVFGAGISGLAAALRLTDEGLSVRVLEAQDRTGGRIHSMRQLGPNAEAGATYIGAGYRRFMALADRFSIPLVDVTPVLRFFREQDLVYQGEIISQKDWPSHPANPFPESDREFMPWNYHRMLTQRENPLARPEDWLDPAHSNLDIPMRDWMLGLGLGEDVVRIGYGINTTFGYDAADVSALLLLFRAAFSRDQRKHAKGDSIGFTVENGVERIPNAIAARLGDAIELGTEVCAVSQSADQVELSLSDGRRLTARRAICAVPYPALRRIALDPPLEGAQADAVSELPHQPITQVYLRPKRPFWDDDGHAPSLYTDTLAGMVAAVRSALDSSTISHLSAWVIGPNADRIAKLGEAEAGAAVIAAIEAVRPAAAGQLELIGLKAWGSDPYAGGAWAYFRPGQVTRFAAAMPGAHRRLHFCGEQLALAGRGLEGALETAETVASEVIAAEAVAI
jgi:monoamine oxidase